MSAIEVVTAADREDLDPQADAAFRPGWPEFIFHDPISNELMKRVEKYFAHYNVYLLEDGAVVAGGWGVPLQWDGEIDSLPDGYDGGLISSVGGHENATSPDTLSVMAAAVRPDRTGQGLAGQVLTALRERAVSAGLARVIAPVRPTLKTRYPLTPMAQFAQWTRADGLHLDPWIRTHQKLGAKILAPTHSMTISGTVAEWEDWTKMAFPQTGEYVVPDALDLVSIDRENDTGVYKETNLWMRHL